MSSTDTCTCRRFIILSFGKSVGGVADRHAGGAAAAILGQGGHQLAHRAVVGGIDQLPAQPPLGDQSSMDELLEMKGQRGRHNAQPFGNDAVSQSFGTARHEQPEQFETGFLGESAECCDRAFLIHRGLSQKFYVSTIIEYMLLTAWILSSIFCGIS